MRFGRRNYSLSQIKIKNMTTTYSDPNSAKMSYGSEKLPADFPSVARKELDVALQPMALAPLAGIRESEPRWH